MNTNSDITTAQADALRDRSAAPKSPEATGLLYQIRGQVTIPATPTVNDTLTLIPAELLPVGAVYEVLDSHLFFETDPGTALQLDIGPASDPDALADALDCNAAGRVELSASGTKPAALLDPVKVSAQEAIIATIKASDTVSATVMQFSIAFRVCA